MPDRLAEGRGTILQSGTGLLSAQSGSIREGLAPPEGTFRQSGADCATLVVMAAQFIYTMRDLKRFYPPDREVLKGINLSFYPGAKIGVIGSNGSGQVLARSRSWPGWMTASAGKPA